MKEHWKKLLQIFWTFFKIGPVTFGGGYAMIPLIEKEVVHNRNWCKKEDLTDIFAIAGTVPGGIAVNAATIIGYRIAGIRGAIAATLGTLIPTFSIVILLCVLFVSFHENQHVKAAFFGIRASIVALIVFAAIKTSRTAIVDKTTLAIAIIMVIIMLVLQWHPIFIIFSGTLVGIFIIKVKEKLGIVVKFKRDDVENKKIIEKVKKVDVTKQEVHS